MTWVEVPPSAPFGTSELPYGIFSVAGNPPRVGVAVADQVIDLAAVCRDVGRDSAVFEQRSLNAFLAQGPREWAEIRRLLQSALSDRSGQALLEPHLSPIRDVQLHLPIEVADYVDFYASENHAANVGQIFRPGGDPLTPNWKHMPIGYHGRAGTVVISGTDVIRPCGQVKSPVIRRRRSGPAASWTSKPSWAGWWAPAPLWACRSRSRISGNTSSGS